MTLDALHRKLVVAISALVIIAVPGRATPPLVELPIEGIKELPQLPHCVWLGFSPNGKWVAIRHIQSKDKDRIIVWERDTWKSQKWDVEGRSDIAGVPNECAFASEGNGLYYCANEKLWLRELGKRQLTEVASVPAPDKGRVTSQSARLLSDNKTLALISIVDERTIRVHRVPSDKKPIELFAATYGTISAVALSEDGSLLVIASRDDKDRNKHVLEVWDTIAQKLALKGEAHDGTVVSVCMSINKRLVMTAGTDGRLVVWDLSTGKPVRSHVEKYTVSSVACHPTTKICAFTTFDRKGDQNLKFAEPLHGRIVGGVAADRHGARLVSFSSDGDFVAAVGGEGVVKIWSISQFLDQKGKGDILLFRCGVSPLTPVHSRHPQTTIISLPPGIALPRGVCLSVQRKRAE